MTDGKSHFLVAAVLAPQSLCFYVFIKDVRLQLIQINWMVWWFIQCGCYYFCV